VKSQLSVLNPNDDGDSEVFGGMRISNSQGSKEYRICGEKVLIFNNVPSHPLTSSDRVMKKLMGHKVMWSTIQGEVK